MAEYNMQELNLPGEDGKRILYPRMKLYGQVNPAAPHPAPGRTARTTG